MNPQPISFGSRSIAAILLMAAMVAACKEPAEGPGGDSRPQETTYATVSIVPDRETMYRNPFSGWVIYSGLGDGLSDNFWQEYDNMDSAVGKVKVSDYANALLIRSNWSQAEPEEGLYFWDEACNTKPARRFRMLRDGARARGLKLIFQLRTDSRDLHENACPDYVRAKGAKGFESTTGSAKVWTPYPDDPVFQQCYEKFLRAFAREFNKPDEVDWMGSWGIGKWGEYHSCIYSTGDETPREPVFDYFSDLFLEIFDKVPVCINFHKAIGTGSGDKTDPDSQRLVQKGIDKGLCLTSGAFGMHGYYGSWEKGFIHTQKWKVPIHAEGGWVRASHSMSAINNDGYKDWAEVRRGEFDDARDACANTMDFRYNSNIGMGETWSWFNEAYDLVLEAIRTQFYRLYPDRIVLPEKAATGSTAKIEHRWVNLGWAYCPTNIKPFKDRFRLGFGLLDPSTGKPVYIFYDDAAKPCDWTYGTPKSYTFSPTLSGVKAGRYEWGVAILDMSRSTPVPGIQIAAKREKTADGWVKLSEVTIE